MEFSGGVGGLTVQTVLIAAIPANGALVKVVVAVAVKELGVAHFQLGAVSIAQFAVFSAALVPSCGCTFSEKSKRTFSILQQIPGKISLVVESSA